ncbi:MAG: MarR family transcriptional regulator [Candidatus Heimdallarchaeota archaeon]|nr:MarR family transcriptional regulator [Candidatus Heimdallarchaeota archaeon]MCG3254969.1 MarR family transcriptional regulator [Candidatus Heimdallarchaeota archaeon]MCK4610043.1 MarR family transcriptional regulator [Candidatus Heimdallarchaeota archaeon]
MTFPLSSFDSKDITCFEIIKAAYALSENELEIMMCIKNIQPVDIKGIAKIIPKDRATISRSIQRLMGIGIVRKTKINLERGGFKYLYSSMSVEELKLKLIELINRISKNMEYAISNLTEEKCKEAFKEVQTKYSP